MTWGAPTPRVLDARADPQAAWSQGSDVGAAAPDSVQSTDSQRRQTDGRRRCQPPVVAAAATAACHLLPTTCGHQLSTGHWCSVRAQVHGRRKMRVVVWEASSGRAAGGRPNGWGGPCEAARPSVFVCARGLGVDWAPRTLLNNLGRHPCLQHEHVLARAACRRGSLHRLSSAAFWCTGLGCQSSAFPRATSPGRYRGLL